MQQQLQIFWAEQYREIEATTDFKSHNMLLARIKKIMKADEDVRMIAAEVPAIFTRACEMFILELTHCGWVHAQENKRRTRQKSNITAGITHTRRTGGRGQHPRYIFGGLLEIAKNRCSISKPASTYFKV
jgi:nuclear transcription factor Y, gamma